MWMDVYIDMAVSVSNLSFKREMRISRRWFPNVASSPGVELNRDGRTCAPNEGGWEGVG